MAGITIIAINQTGSPLSLSKLSVPDAQIPATGSSVTLTDYNTIEEIKRDSELLTYIQGGQVLLNDGANTLSQAESERLLSDIVFGYGSTLPGTILVYDPVTNTLTGSSATIDSSGNLNLGSGSLSIAAGQNLSASVVQGNQITSSFIGLEISGTAASPALSFLNDPGTGIYLEGDGQLSITTNGTRRFRVGVGDAGTEHLYPHSNGNYDLGSASLDYRTLYIQNINTATTSSIEVRAPVYMLSHYFTGSVTGSDAKFGIVSGTFTGSGANIYDITASNIPNFTTDVRGQFTAGTNITITNGEISSTGGGTPGGLDTNVQFNSGSTFSGSNNLVYDYTNAVLSGTQAQFTGITGSLVGNASTVTNGVYTDTNNTYTGINTFNTSYITGSITGSDAKFTSVSGAFNGSGAGITGIDHGNLAGLSDNDHDQYLMRGGSNQINGNHNPETDGQYQWGETNAAWSKIGTYVLQAPVTNNIIQITGSMVPLSGSNELGSTDANWVKLYVKSLESTDAILGFSSSFELAEVTAPAGTPSNGKGWLYANSADSRLYWKNDLGVAYDLTSTGSGNGTPGGADTNIQFNSGSAFGGSSNLTYNYTTFTLSGTQAQFIGITGSLVGNASTVTNGVYTNANNTYTGINTFNTNYITGSITGSVARFTQITGSSALFTALATGSNATFNNLTATQVSSGSIGRFTQITGSSALFTALATGSNATFNNLTATQVSSGSIGRFNQLSGSFISGNASAITKFPVSKAITILSPGSTEEVAMFYTPVAITISQLHSVVQGTTPSATWQVRHGTDRSAAGNAVMTASQTTTSTTTGTTVDSGFNDATVPANSWVWMEITATAGTVDEFSLTVGYSRD